MSYREPNFLIAGGVATGTSFLSHAIKDHPRIYLPPVMRPECGFFYKSWEFRKGKDYYLHRWFREARDEVARGERSSLYLHGDFNQVAERIHSLYPRMKLIFCLRNPTERAWANYRFTALTGFETLPFREALDREQERKRRHQGWRAEIQPNLYRERGCYIQYLERFDRLFPPEQILCLKSETLAAEPERCIRQVYEFLGVDPDGGFTLPEKFTSPNVKSLRVQSVLRKLFGAELDQVTEDFRKKKNSWAGRVIGWNLTEDKKPLDPEIREELNAYYAPYNQALAKRLGWDLSDWR